MRDYRDIKALKLGAKNNEIPLVILGNGYFVHKIGEELKQICPVWVFPLPNHIDFFVWTGDQNLITVENMAGVYRDLILKHVPDRKIMLTGYSFSGILAFEVAHQLKGAGIAVDLVILLDTYLQRMPDVRIWKRMFYFFTEGKPFMAFRLLFLTLSEIGPAKQPVASQRKPVVKQKQPELQQTPTVMQEAQPVMRQTQPEMQQKHQDMQKKKPTLKQDQPGVQQRQPDMLQWAEWAEADRYIEWKVCGNEIMKMRTKAQHRYNIKPLYCKGILIRTPLTENDILRRVFKDYGWSRYFEGGLGIVESNGDHNTILLDPSNILMVAKKIKEILTFQ